MALIIDNILILPGLTIVPVLGNLNYKCVIAKVCGVVVCVENNTNGRNRVSHPAIERAAVT